MQRIRSRQQFQAVMAGAPVAKTPHFALHRAVLDGQLDGRPLFPVKDTWIGVLLPKRWAKRAVTRNAIRRQIYETARLQADGLPQVALVVRLRTAFSRQEFFSASSEVLKRAVRAELDQLYTQLARRAARPAAPDVEAVRAV
ncbi:MAG: ribonuclease P protein component [Gammaproteobacteria bacterium]